MRTPIARRLAVPVLAALVALVGCGGDGGDDDAATTSTTEPEADGGTTATADDGATTTGDAGATTEADEGTGTSTDDAGGTTAPATAGEGQEGTGAPDEEAPDVDWGLDASRYRGEDGTRVAFLCPPDGEIGSVRGTGTYTDDSSVCSAAVHAGIINPVEGGRVVIEIAPGERVYEGSEANGVIARDYGAWDGSFTFPTA